MMKKYEDFTIDDLIHEIDDIQRERDEYRKCLESIAFSEVGDSGAKNKAARALGISGPF